MSFGWIVSFTLVGAALVSYAYYCSKSNCLEAAHTDSSAYRVLSRPRFTAENRHHYQCACYALDSLFEQDFTTQEGKISSTDSSTGTIAKALASLNLSFKKKTCHQQVHKTRLKLMPLLKRDAINKKIASHKKPCKRRLSLQSHKTSKNDNQKFWKQYRKLKHTFKTVPQ